MKMPYSNKKVMHFAFSRINYEALIELVKKIDSGVAIRIIATNITWNDAYANLCRMYPFKAEWDTELVSIISETDIRDGLLLQIVEALHNMEPEELNISVYSDADFSGCLCEIMIMYYEETATICFNDTLSIKELKLSCSNCFI